MSDSQIAMVFRRDTGPIMFLVREGRLALPRAEVNGAGLAGAFRGFMQDVFGIDPNMDRLNFRTFGPDELPIRHIAFYRMSQRVEPLCGPGGVSARWLERCDMQHPDRLSETDQAILVHPVVRRILFGPEAK